MPQGSLFDDQELAQVEVKLRYDDIAGCVKCSLVATSRKGQILASGAVVAVGMEQTELLPILVAESCYGFLYRGSRDAVVVPLSAYRSRRKDVAKA